MSSLNNIITNSAIIGLGASATTFIGLLINTNPIGSDWRDVSFYGLIGCAIVSKYVLTGKTLLDRD